MNLKNVLTTSLVRIWDMDSSIESSGTKKSIVD